MNGIIKDGDFFQSDSSPSFKNLRIEGDSPTITNYIHQVLNSQQSIGYNISSSETPTMKRTSSFKNHAQLFKVDSRENQNGNSNTIQNRENLFQYGQYENKELEPSLGKDQTRTSGKLKNSRMYEEQLIANDKEDNSFLELKQNEDSEKSSDINELDSSDIQVQNSTDQSTRMNQNSSDKKQKNKRGRVTKQKVEKKKGRCEMSEQLFYDKNLECKYNSLTQIHSGNCNLHNQEIFNFLCFTCNELLCNDCVNIHIGHQIQTIKNSYPFCKKSIQNSLDVLNKKIEKLLIHSEDLTSIQNDVIETFQQQKHEIQRVYKILIASIKSQTNDLMEYCSKLYKEKYDFIAKKHNEVRQDLNNMIESHRVIEKNLQTNDQFITCDYYSKKLKVLNQIISSENQEQNQILTTFGNSFLNSDTLKGSNIYKNFPQNCRLNINEKRMIQQIDREFIQLKINLGKFHVNVGNRKQAQEIDQIDDRNSLNQNALFESNFTSPVNRNFVKNNFMSLQSSPFNRQSEFQNEFSNQVSNFQNESMKQNACNQDQVLLNQYFLHEQKPQLNLQQPSNQNYQSKLQENNNLNPIKNQYYFNKTNQQKMQLPEQIGASNFSDLSSNSQNLLNNSNFDIFNKNSSTFFQRNPSQALQQQQQQQQQQMNKQSNHFLNIPISTTRNKLSDRSYIDNHNLLQISNNTSLCSNSTRLPAPISKSPSPIKKINQEFSEGKAQQLLSSNKETKVILSSPNIDNPLYLFNYEKTDKEITQRDSLGSNKHHSFLEEKYNSKLNQCQNIENSIKHDLFSSNVRDKTLLDLNNDTNSMSKFNKEIEQIKQLLYQDNNQGCRRTPRDHYLKENKNSSKNKGFKAETNSKGCFSANHSPNRETLDINFTKFQNNFNINFPQSNKMAGEDRSRSPNFFKSNNTYQKSNSPNTTASTPKSQSCLNSFYNQLKQEKILHSHFQLEGFLNSIRKQDRLSYESIIQKVQSTSNNSENQQQIQQKQNHSQISHSQLNIIDKNNNQLINKVNSKPYIRSISNHQCYDTPLHKISKEKLTEQLIQNIIKQRIQGSQSNLNCSEKPNNIEIKKDQS